MSPEGTQSASALIEKGSEAGTPVYKHILVCIDGSECSAKALKEAIRITKCGESELTVLHVARVSSSWYASESHAPIDRHQLELEKKGKGYVDDARAETARAGIEAKTVLATSVNSPVKAITRYAARNDVDLIVIGTRGLGLKRVLVGSVSNGVVRHAHCPVLVVK